MQSRTIRTQSGRYVAVVGSAALRGLADHLGDADAVVVVTDENVAARYGPAVADSLNRAGLVTHEWTIPPGETSKSLWQAECLYDFLASKRCGRDSAIVALGGGVVGDLAGFVASTWLRGIPYVYCPTTMLAAVDAAIGGKTGLNHAGLKNMVGSFYPPAAVCVDVDTLATLDDRTFRSGMAESLKHGLIADASFLQWQVDQAEAIASLTPEVLEKLIIRNIEIKADIVEQDEFDRVGVRAKLNLGHTIGHALEVVSGYGLTHGECVGLGMLGAFHVSVAKRFIEPAAVDTVREALDRFSLPTSFKYDGEVETIMAAMRGDKKSVKGTVRFVLPTGIGQVSVGHAVEEDQVRAALAQLLIG